MLTPMLTHAISYLGDGLIWWTFMEALPWDSLGWWRSWIVEFRAVNCGRLGNRTTGSCLVKPIINLQLFMVYTSCFWWIWGLFFFFGLLLDVERFLKNCRQVSQSKLGEEQAALQNLQSENAELHRRLEVQTNIIQMSTTHFFLKVSLKLQTYSDLQHLSTSHSEVQWSMSISPELAPGVLQSHGVWRGCRSNGKWGGGHLYHPHPLVYWRYWSGMFLYSFYSL